MTSFRNGQWVKFDLVGLAADVAGIHKSKDGKGVGIYSKGGGYFKVDVALNGEEEDKEVAMDVVVPVDKDGYNVVKFEKGEIKQVKFLPSQLVGLEPVLVKSDIPEARLVGVDPNWTPKA